MRPEITDDLIDALIDAQDDTLVAMRSALLRELAQEEDVHAREMILAGIPVAERYIVDLTGRLRDAGFDDTAARLEAAQERQTRLLALSIAERTRSSPCSSTARTASQSSAPMLIQEAVWRDREGLG